MFFHIYFVSSFCFSKVTPNVPALGEVANFGTLYFLLKIKFLAKSKREFTTKFAIARNGCQWLAFYLFWFFDISTKFKYSFLNSKYQFIKSLFFSGSSFLWNVIKINNKKFKVSTEVDIESFHERIWIIDPLPSSFVKSTPLWTLVEWIFFE